MKCRLCDSSDLKLYYTQGNNSEYKFYKCNNCELVNYDIDGGLDQSKYSYEYISPENESHKQNKTQTKSFNYIKKNLSNKGKLLDIGCGNGKILLLAQNYGWEVRGLELSKYYAETILNKYGINVEVSNFLEYDVSQEEKYDFVILRHVLEHLPDSILAMKKINQLLKPGGIALLEFPNIESLEAKIKRAIPIFKKKKYKQNYKPGHCNEFSKKSFQFLANKTCFELISWNLYSNKIDSSFLLTKLNISSKARVLVKKVCEYN